MDPTAEVKQLRQLCTLLRAELAAQASKVSLHFSQRRRLAALLSELYQKSLLDLECFPLQVLDRCCRSPTM